MATRGCGRTWPPITVVMLISVMPKNAWKGSEPNTMASLVIGWMRRGAGSIPITTQ